MTGQHEASSIFIHPESKRVEHLSSHLRASFLFPLPDKCPGHLIRRKTNLRVVFCFPPPRRKFRKKKAKP